MNQTCLIYVDCPPNPSFPLLGFSSETNDASDFISMAFAPVQSAPLGWNFGLRSGFAIATNTVSQSAACQSAYSAAVAYAQSTWSAPGAVLPQPQSNPQNAQETPIDGSMFDGELAGITEIPIF